ncbi:MAG: PhoH family protein [Planctomycetota bacterium]|jgi:phosphate starvation-inducible PhoH-like protein
MRATTPIESPEEVRVLLGITDSNARVFRSRFNVALTLRKGELHLDGEEEDVKAAQQVVDEVLQRFRRTGQVDPSEVEVLLRAGGAQVEIPADAIGKNRSNRAVVPRTPNQQHYVDAMLKHEMVFAVGPAGTGKTYLAVAMAVRMLRDGTVKKIILTRPAVEAGEKLGFLPGTYEAKVNPYLRPLYDALYDLLDPVQIRKFQDSEVIEVAPLAYMRGRTLSDAYIILDEAQNTTRMQMKMFLTRMGQGSRMVVTGDVTQIDLPPSTVSGMVHAMRLLKRIKSIRICNFDRDDIIRHPVVQEVVDAYEREAKGKKS